MDFIWGRPLAQLVGVSPRPSAHERGCYRRPALRYASGVLGFGCVQRRLRHLEWLCSSTLDNVPEVPMLYVRWCSTYCRVYYFSAVLFRESAHPDGALSGCRELPLRVRCLARSLAFCRAGNGAACQEHLEGMRRHPTRCPQLLMCRRHTYDLGHTKPLPGFGSSTCSHWWGATWK